MSPNAEKPFVPQVEARNISQTCNDRSSSVRVISRSSNDISSFFENSNVSTHLSNASGLPISRKHPKCMDTQYSPMMVPTVARNSHPELTWMKARAQQTRGRLLHEYSDEEKLKEPYHHAHIFNILVPTGVGPKRQRSAFVKDEELKCMREDRVGTPHISELQHDEDMTVQLDDEELGLAGAVDMLIAKDDRLEEAEAPGSTVPS